MALMSCSSLHVNSFIDVVSLNDHTPSYDSGFSVWAWFSAYHVNFIFGAGQIIVLMSQLHVIGIALLILLPGRFGFMLIFSLQNIFKDNFSINFSGIFSAWPDNNQWLGHLIELITNIFETRVVMCWLSFACGFDWWHILPTFRHMQWMLIKWPERLVLDRDPHIIK